MPDAALLQRYREPPFESAYTDCFTAGVDGAVSLDEFVFAFYTTPLFRLERVILACLAKLPSSDEQARQLLAGEGNAFAAWTLEERAEDQLLMCDVRQRTRSWFMVAGGRDRSPEGSRLYFGSAVVPRGGTGGIGRGFGLLLAFHKLYSILLLRAARQRLLHARAT